MEFSEENLQNQDAPVLENQQPQFSAQPVEQNAVMSEQEETDVSDEDDEDDNALAFPTARVDTREVSPVTSTKFA